MEVWKYVRNGRMGWPLSATVVYLACAAAIIVAFALATHPHSVVARTRAVCEQVDAAQRNEAQ
jgi:hypothetical protein